MEVSGIWGDRRGHGYIPSRALLESRPGKHLPNASLSHTIHTS